MARSLLDFIAKYEAGPAGYQSTYGNKGNRDFSTMPFDAVVQDSLARGQKYGSGATGNLQFMGETLKDLKRTEGLTGNELFTNDLQDQLGMSLLKRRGLDEFMSGDLSEGKFLSNLAHEWAGLPEDQRGLSAYHKDKMGNKAQVGYDETMEAIRALKNGGGGGIPMTSAAYGSPVTPANVPDAPGAMAPAAAAGGAADTGSWLDQQIQQLMSGQGQQGQAMAAQQPQTWQDKIAGKLNSPLVQVGLGILGANGNYGDWAGAIGQGASQGLKNYNQAQAQQASQKPKQSSALDQLSRATKMMDLRDRMSERKAAQSYRASLDPEERAMSEAAAAGDPTAQMALKERFTPEAGPEVSSSAVKYSELLNMRGPDGAPLYTPEEAAGIAYKTGGTTVNVGQQGAEGGIQYGNVQPGYMRTVDRETGVPTDTPISGTTHDMDRKKAERNAQAAFAANDRMRELVETHGEGLDLVGNPEATARMRMVIQEQLKNMANVSDTGVINEGEAERMLKALADPTKKFTFADVESIVGAIDEFDQRLERALGIKKIPGWTPENPEGTGGAGGSSGLNEGLGDGWSIELDEDIAAAGGA